MCLVEPHTGPIFAGSASSSPLKPQTQISSTDLGLELQKARHDPKVKAVVLRVDSPGAAAPHSAYTTAATHAQHGTAKCLCALQHWYS